MEGSKAALALALFVLAQLIHVLSSPATVPAFVWSPHNYGDSHCAGKGVVNYQTIAPKELAKSVLSEGSWSNLLCSGEDIKQSVDIALIFIGRKLRTSDISRGTFDPSLVDLLKLSFSSSNVSMAFPYVAVPDERENLENSLIAGFADNCGSDLGFNHISYMGSCSINSNDVKKLEDLDSLQEFLNLRMESAANRKTDMIVFCSGGFGELKNQQSDGEILSRLVTFLEQLGAKYAVLYASDPYRPRQYTSYPVFERFLLEDAHTNGSVNSTHCDGVCQIKSSLLEGVFVVSNTTFFSQNAVLSIYDSPLTTDQTLCPYYICYTEVESGYFNQTNFLENILDGKLYRPKCLLNDICKTVCLLSHLYSFVAYSVDIYEVIKLLRDIGSCIFAGRDGTFTLLHLDNQCAKLMAVLIS